MEQPTLRNTLCREPQRAEERLWWPRRAKHQGIPRKHGPCTETGEESGEGRPRVRDFDGLESTVQVSAEEATRERLPEK